jgi:hypothetical protein
MTYADSLFTLATWLSGEFDNRSQAIDQPTWFVHLRLWHRPLPHRLDGKIAIFAEQANILQVNQPYRQRVMMLETASSDQLQVRYLAFNQPSQFRGAGAAPNLLKNVSMADFDLLPGCELTVTQKNGKFVAQPEPDAKCFFQYDGKTRQVILGFDVSDRQFWSYDRGVDPDTGQLLWGAMMGAYQFEKRESFEVAVRDDNYLT